MCEFLTDIDIEDYWTSKLLSEKKYDWQGSLPVKFDNKSVLILGAAGSIGSALMLQMSAMSLKKLTGADHSEYSIFNLRQTLGNSHLHKDVQMTDFILTDIRDKDSLRRAFEKAKPDIVVNAAALKHVQLAEENVYEAFLTNVWGTKQVADLCYEMNVSVLINISTDKAADPVSVLGYTKRIAEIYVQALSTVASSKPTRYASIRLGNVFFSSGSVLPRFLYQAENHGLLTLTSEKSNRFFISKKDAASFIINVSDNVFLSTEKDAGLFIPKMSKPLAIKTIAEAIKADYMKRGKSIEIRTTSLCDGEKEEEVLIGRSESFLDYSVSNILKINTKTVDYDTVDEYINSLKSGPQFTEDKLRNDLRRKIEFWI